MLSFEIINRPSNSVVRLLENRIRAPEIKEWLRENKLDSVGLVQGQMYEIISAMDIAEKASSVYVSEIVGSCPSRVVLIAIIGSLDSVRTAVESIQNRNSQNSDSASML